MTGFATIVNWDDLAEAVCVSVIVGLGVLVVAGLAVRSSLSAEDRRGGPAAVAYAGVTVVCVLALIGSIGAGIYLLTE
jgi:hypothetical protein